MRVLVLDPGERVGWAVAEITERNAVTVAKLDAQRHTVLSERPAYSTLRVEGHGISFLKDMALAMYRALVVERKYDVVIYETWRLRASKSKAFIGSEFHSSQFIGMVRLCCWLANVTIVSQDPGDKAHALRSMAKHPDAAYIRDALAKMPADHDDGHDGDALMHLWAFYFARYV